MGPEQSEVVDLDTHEGEVGWLHHAWDEVGPQLTTGVCLIVVAVIGYLGVRHKVHRKFKIPKGHWRGNRRQE